MTQQSPSDIVRHASTWSILCGVALIVLGVLAVGSPALAAVAVNAVISWLIVLAGVVHLSLAFYAHKAGVCSGNCWLGSHMFSLVFT